MSRLKFYPKSHRYKLDGQWVPGVTTLLKGLPKDALMYWSARTVAEYVADNPEGVEQLRSLGRNSMVAALKEIPWQKRDDAASRGTIVHAITEQIVTGAAVEVDELHAGYVEAAVAFLDDYSYQPIVTERPHFHEHHLWAGTPDTTGTITSKTLGTDRLAVIDWKTGDSGIWPETALQLGAYAHATHYQDDHDTDHEAPHPDLGIAVQLCSDGTYRAWSMRVDDHSYSRFRHVAVVHQVGKSMKDDRQSWMTELTEETP